MEEKERYELFGEHCIKDNDPNARCQLLDVYKACVMLNQQNERIKEFEDFMEDEDFTGLKDLKTYIKLQSDASESLIHENYQLKQSQKQLAISELENVKDILWSSQDIGNLIDNDIFLDRLNNRIKALKGE